MRAKLQVLGTVALLIIFLGSTAYASELRQATLSNVRGDVFIRQGDQDWQPAKTGTILHKSDAIKTSDGGYAEVLLDNGKVGSVQIHQKSQFKLGTLDLDEATGEKHTLLDLAIGRVMVHAEKLQGNSTFEVRTPTSTTGVRGTMFEVSVE